ncbi:MAG: hypothetical protein ACI9YT_000475 [Halobacteriales archaeon]|jgi:hypothetical protein
MDDRRDPDRDRPPARRSVGRRSFLGGVGGLALAALAGCTTTEKPKGTLIEGDGTDVGGVDTTTVPGTPTPDEIFTLSDTSFGPNDEGYMTYAATVENTTDERWAATLHARLELGRPITPEGDEESATPTPLTPRETELTREIDLGPRETQDVALTFDVTETAYFELYRSASFGISWSDHRRP